MPCPIAFLDAYPCISRVPFVLLLCRCGPRALHPTSTTQKKKGKPAKLSVHATRVAHELPGPRAARGIAVAEPMVHVHAVCVDAAVAWDVAATVEVVALE